MRPCSSHRGKARGWGGRPPGRHGVGGTATATRPRGPAWRGPRRRAPRWRASGLQNTRAACGQWCWLRISSTLRRTGGSLCGPGPAHHTAGSEPDAGGPRHTEHGPSDRVGPPGPCEPVAPSGRVCFYQAAGIAVSGFPPNPRQGLSPGLSGRRDEGAPRGARLSVQTLAGA